MKGIPIPQGRKIWRWELVAGLCFMHGYRYGAELGVSTGRFTSFLCSRIPDLRMIAVDLWQPQPGNDRIAGGESYEDWHHDAHYENFVRHATAQFPNRVEIHRECSWEAARHVADGALDFVFVDADHAYDSVVKDIEAWLPKVRPGGVIAGHDYDWPTTGKAVDDTLGVTALADDSVWFKYVART